MFNLLLCCHITYQACDKSSVGNCRSQMAALHYQINHTAFVDAAPTLDKTGWQVRGKKSTLFYYKRIKVTDAPMKVNNKVSASLNNGSSVWDDLCAQIQCFHLWGETSWHPSDTTLGNCSEWHYSSLLEGVGPYFEMVPPGARLAKAWEEARLNRDPLPPA